MTICFSLISNVFSEQNKPFKKGVFEAGIRPALKYLPQLRFGQYIQSVDAAKVILMLVKAIGSTRQVGQYSGKNKE
jgi:hypothetical protein